MKDTKKIGVLISIVLISLLAISAVSAAEDAAISDDADLLAVEEVSLDNAPTIDEIDYESTDIALTDAGDSDDSDRISDDADLQEIRELQKLGCESSCKNDWKDEDDNYASAPGTYKGKVGDKECTANDYVAGEALGVTTNAIITAELTEITDTGSVSLNLTFIDGENMPVTGNVNISVDGGDAQEYPVTAGLANITLNGLAFGEHTILLSSDEYDANTVTLTANVIPKKGTYADLQWQIDNAGDSLDLSYDFAFDEEYDIAINPNLYYGVVVDKPGSFTQFFTINANGFTICGRGLARIFNIVPDSKLNLNNATLCHAYADEGGAIFVSQSGFIRANNVIFRDNNATFCGGAIAGIGDVKVTGCQFINNSAGDKGGAIYASSVVDVSACIFDKNDIYGRHSSDEFGGAAIYSIFDSALIRDSIISNSNPSYTDGDMETGAITIIGDVRITNVTFSNNKGYWGGAISSSVAQYTLLIKDCRFIDNEAYQGGAIFNQGKVLIVEYSNFTQNTATDGGAIYYDNQEVVNSYLEISNSTFNGNEASNGGAIYSNGVIYLDDSYFANNNGEANVYNLYTNGSIGSAIGNTFEGINPSLTMNSSFIFGEVIPVNGTFDWGVNNKVIKVQFSINGAPIEADVSVDGKFAVDIDSQPDVGTYTVVIISFTDADGNTYVVNPVVKTFNVTKAVPVIIANGSTVEYGEPSTVNVTVTDGDGSPILGKVIVEVLWQGGSADDVVVLDENGKGQAVFNLAAYAIAPGTFDVKVTYIETDNYAEAIATSNVTVTDSSVGPDKKIATVITYNKKSTITYNKTIDNKKNYYITATLKDANGKVLAGKRVKVFSHGKSYTTKTNAKGQLKISIAHSRYGDCTTVVSFEGDSKYEASFVAVYVSIKKQKVKLTSKKKTFKASKKVKKFTATLKNSKGKALAGKKIVFTINKKKYTAKTNKKGVATVKVKLSKKKTYKVKVQFAGDLTYAKKTKNTKLVIK